MSDLASVPCTVEKWIWVKVKREKIDRKDDDHFISHLPENLKPKDDDIEALEYFKVSGTTEEIEKAMAAVTTYNIRPNRVTMKDARSAYTGPMDAVLSGPPTITIDFYFCFGMIQRLEDLSDKVEAVVAYLKGLCNYQHLNGGDIVYKVRLIEQPREYIFTSGDITTHMMQDVVEVKTSCSDCGPDFIGQPNQDVMDAMGSWKKDYGVDVVLKKD